MIPSFLLAKFYVTGTLKNNDTGFEFALKNIFDSTLLSGIGLIQAGEKIYEAQNISMLIGEKTINGTDLSRSNCILVRSGMTGKVLVAGHQLVATTSDTGKFQFELSDTVESSS